MTERNPRREPAGNRGRILSAATDEFARFGLGGARVDRIAARAGANKRMLYYYYGNKEALFLAVLEAAYTRIRAAEQRMHLEDLDPEEAVRRLVALTWLFRRPLLSPVQRAERLKHMTEVVLGYLRYKGIRS